MKVIHKSVDEYIESFPASVQMKLQLLRNIIRKAAPDSTEKISYNMPTYIQDGPLLHFAAYDQHISLYGATLAMKAFEKELKPHITGRGTVQFDLGEALPTQLIKRVVEHTVETKLKKTSRKRKTKVVRTRS